MKIFCKIYLVVGIGQTNKGIIFGAFTTENLAWNYLGPNLDYNMVTVRELEVQGE
jgi:hypothetical protein